MSHCTCDKLGWIANGVHAEECAETVISCLEFKASTYRHKLEEIARMENRYKFPSDAEAWLELIKDVSEFLEENS